MRLKKEQRRKIEELTKRVVSLALGRDGNDSPCSSLVELKVSLKFSRANRQISPIGIYSFEVQVVQHSSFKWPKTNHGLQTQFLPFQCSIKQALKIERESLFIATYCEFQNSNFQNFATQNNPPRRKWRSPTERAQSEYPFQAKFELSTRSRRQDILGGTWWCHHVWPLSEKRLNNVWPQKT